MARYGIHRKEALPMEKLVEEYIREMKLSAGLNTQRIFEAWDTVSGAAAYTLKRFFRNGKLYITPGVKDIIIPKGYYIKDTLNVVGDSNLQSKNIKSGVEIFDIVGNYTGN